MDRSTAKLVNRLTAMLVNCLTATLVNRLTAKLVVVNLVKLHLTELNINLSLTEHKGSTTGEYWPEVVGARSVQKRPRANIPQCGLS